MATVAELKENLLQDRLALAEVAQMSVASIDTVVSFSSWVLGILATVLAILSVIGWLSIRNAARNIAEERIKDYIKSQKFKDWLKDTVVKAYEADQNRERVRSKVVIMDDLPNAAFEEREFSDG